MRENREDCLPEKWLSIARGSESVRRGSVVREVVAALFGSRIPQGTRFGWDCDPVVPSGLGRRTGSDSQGVESGSLGGRRRVCAAMDHCWTDRTLSVAAAAREKKSVRA